MFKLAHVVLYSKGWYQTYHPLGKRKTIWDDLHIILDMDDYSMYEDKPDKRRITSLILNNFEELRGIIPQTKLLDFYNGIQESECWKYGYITNKTQEMFPKLRDKQFLTDYDPLEAIVHYCLSAIRFLDPQYFKKTKPDYTRLPKGRGIKDKYVNETFLNQ